jgi:hypothetical protein
MELTIRELAAASAAAVEANALRASNRRVTELPDERTIRWYATIGLLDRPSGRRGRTSLYGERHLLQLLAIKRRQAEGRTIAEIQQELLGATDRTLRRIAGPRFWGDAPAGVGPAAGIWPGVRPVVRPVVALVAAPATAPPPGPSLSTGIGLGGEVVLLVPGHPSDADLTAIRAAAQPLLDLLDRRRLRGSGSATSIDDQEGGPQ